MRRVLVSFILAYFRIFARLALAVHKPTVIGITGSVGKSSARNAVYAAIKDKGRVKAIEKGNSETGVPLGILGLAPKDYSPLDWLTLLVTVPFRTFYLKKTDYLIIEMGIDEPDPPKNMSYLLSIVKPDIAVFLNVHPVHTMQFDKTVPAEITGAGRLKLILQNIAREKGLIITESQCRIGIYNADNQFVANVIAQKAIPHTQLLTFGVNDGNDISYKQYDVNLSGTKFGFKLKNKTMEISFKNYFLPEEYREVFAAAVLVGKSLDMSNEEIQAALEKNYWLPAGRSTVLEGINSSVIIDSSYNASKAAVTAFIKLVKKVKKDRPFVFLFGDMRELGRESEAEHKAVAEEIDKSVDFLYCVGPQTKQFVMPNVKKARETKWFEKSTEAGEYLKQHLPQNAIILVKGSQNTIFLEEGIKPLLAHPEDVKHLCRQSDFWMKKKKSLTKTSF